MKTQQVIYLFWISQLALKGLLVVVLFLRGVRKSFPVFTVFAVFNLLGGLVGLFSYRIPKLYVYVYITNESLSILLGLAVVYEIFRHLFSTQAALQRLASVLLGSAVALLVLLSGALVYAHSPTVRNVASAVWVAEEAARALELGLLMFLFVCSRTFGLHWRQPVFGITLGMGLFIAVQTAVMALSRYAAAWGASFVANIATMVAFHVSALIWIGYLLTPEKTTSQEMPDKSQLEQWNRAVMELIHQ